jgi:hypothetical protein
MAVTGRHCRTLYLTLQGGRQGGTTVNQHMLPITMHTHQQQHCDISVCIHYKQQPAAWPTQADLIPAGRMELQEH